MKKGSDSKLAVSKGLFQACSATICYACVFLAPGFVERGRRSPISISWYWRKRKTEPSAAASLRNRWKSFAREMRLAAAIHWYERGEISQEKAARIADLDRADFLAALAREKANAFVVDFDDLKWELERVVARRDVA